jgi:uncharacterized protein DUF3631
MSTPVGITISAIDQVIDPHDCVVCGQELVYSPSNDFCSDDCQTRWQAQQVGPAAALTDGGAQPSQDLPETAPVRPLAWLGKPPPGAIAQAGLEVLNDVTALVSRFCVFPSEHYAPTLALWCAHTHIADRLYVTPRLILDSAEPGSGKTRVLEIARFLVSKPEMTISITPAAIFRMLADGPITLLFDEIDAVFSSKSGGNNEDLRALLNAGYKRSATVARCVGDAKNMGVARFPVYAPVALAGIAGGMPDTITTRAITMHLRKRRLDEDVEEFIEEDVEREVAPIRDELAAWVARVADEVTTARPERPDGVRDRAAEIWRPLLAIADAAGGKWPEVARAACSHFVNGEGPKPVSRGVALLDDMRNLFRAKDTDRIATTEILAALRDLDESPWADVQGKPLDPRRLSQELERYQVRPVTFTAKTGKAKGYVTYATTGKQAQVGLSDAWSRYLAPVPTEADAHSEGEA